MTDKVAIITGSSSGIGEATAKLFMKHGYQVVITGNYAEKLAQVVETTRGLSPKGLEPLVVVADLRQPENVDTILEKTLEKFGRLDVLVNNAGTVVKPISDNVADNYDAYRSTMSINLDSTVRLSLAALPHLTKTKGNIVNVSSIASMKTVSGLYAYSVSKAAITMFSKCLACDAAPHVRVNTISPGPVATPGVQQIGMDLDQFRKYAGDLCLTGRVGESEEIAKAIYYLTSDDASFITGSDLIIDGGCILAGPQILNQALKQQ